MAKSVSDAVMKRDFGTAAEILIPHLMRGANTAVNMAYEGIKKNITDPDKGSADHPLGAPIIPGPSEIGGLLDEVAASGEAHVGALKQLSKMIYTPEGELTPIAKGIVHPTQLPEAILRQVIPEDADVVAEREAAAAYEQKAQDLMQRTGDVATEGQQAGGMGAPLPEAPTEEEKLAQAIKEGRAAKIPTRIPRSALKKAVEEPASPLEGMSSSSPEEVKELPEVKTSPEKPSGSETSSSSSPQVKVEIKTPSSPKASGKGKIVLPGTPEAEPNPIKGSYWSYPEAQLRKAVLAGDRAAAIVYRMRYNTLPEGAKYLTDVADASIKGLYKGSSGGR